MSAGYLADYNNKLVFKCRKHKRVSLIHSNNTRDGPVYIEITLSLKKYPHE